MSGCERYEMMISALIDGELDEDEREELSAHIAGCEHCSELAVAFAASSGALADGLEEPPAGFHESVMEHIIAIARATRAQNRFRRLRPVIAAAACVAVIAITVLAANRGVRMADSAANGVSGGENTTVTMEAGITMEAAESAGEGSGASEPAMFAAGGSAADNGAVPDADGLLLGDARMAAEEPAVMSEAQADKDAVDAESSTDEAGAEDAPAEETPLEEAEPEETPAEEEPGEEPTPGAVPLTEMTVEVYGIGEGYFTALVEYDPSGNFWPGAFITVSSAAPVEPYERVTVYWDYLGEAAPGAYYVIAQEVENIG